MMFFQKITYRFITAIFLFLVCLVLSIIFHAYYILAIPFIWLLFPIVFEFCVNRTGDLFWVLIFALPLSTELNVTASLGIDWISNSENIARTQMVPFQPLHGTFVFDSALHHDLDIDQCLFCN